MRKARIDDVNRDAARAIKAYDDADRVRSYGRDSSRRITR